MPPETLIVNRLSVTTRGFRNHTLALASASVLVPLESVQFLVNLLFGKFIRKKQVTLRMVFGTVLLIAGIVLVVLFGSHEYYCYTEDILRDKWLNWTWIIYFIVTFGVAAVFYLVWRKVHGFA